LSGVVLFFSFTGIKFTTMKRISLLSVVYWFSLSLAAQNVGINNPTPAEKLDVNGNINVTGTIKANGVDGAANQVLMKNSSGVLSWGDMCEYKNAVTFTTVGSSTWPIPAGVTKIRVEIWGGGGGSSVNGSGGGGGYCTGVFIVSGGSLSYTIGSGGTGGSPGTAGTLSSASYGIYSINAFGGEGDNNAATLSVALGGGFSGSSNAGFYGIRGQDGAIQKITGFQTNSTTYRVAFLGGKGGDGGNTTNTGGTGGVGIYDGVTGTNIKFNDPVAGSIPGGGGGSNGNNGGGTLKNGGQGMIIIHY
jgi:hypothetical protein